jgi:hypothetical protein
VHDNPVPCSPENLKSKIYSLVFLSAPHDPQNFVASQMVYNASSLIEWYKKIACGFILSMPDFKKVIRLNFFSTGSLTLDEYITKEICK